MHMHTSRKVLFLIASILPSAFTHASNSESTPSTPVTPLKKSNSVRLLVTGTSVTSNPNFDATANFNTPEEAQQQQFNALKTTLQQFVWIVQTKYDATVQAINGIQDQV